MSDHLCSQFITEPTRLNNTLDLYLTYSEELINHIPCRTTPLSDYKLVETYWSYIPCNLIPSAPPDFSKSTFISLNFFKADYPGHVLTTWLVLSIGRRFGRSQIKLINLSSFLPSVFFRSARFAVQKRLHATIKSITCWTSWIEKGVNFSPSKGRLKKTHAAHNLKTYQFIE